MDSDGFNKYESLDEINKKLDEQQKEQEKKRKQRQNASLARAKKARQARQARVNSEHVREQQLQSEKATTMRKLASQANSKPRAPRRRKPKKNVQPTPPKRLRVFRPVRPKKSRKGYNYRHDNYKHRLFSDNDILYQLKHASYLISNSKLDNLLKPHSVVTRNNHHRVLYNFRTSKPKNGRPKNLYKSTRVVVSKDLLNAVRQKLADEYKIPQAKIKHLTYHVLIPLELSMELPKEARDALVDSLSYRYKQASSIIRKVQKTRDGRRNLNRDKNHNSDNFNNYANLVVGDVNRNYKLMQRNAKANRKFISGLLIGLAFLIQKLVVHSDYNTNDLNHMLQSNSSLRILDSLLNSGGEEAHRYKSSKH